MISIQNWLKAPPINGEITPYVPFNGFLKPVIYDGKTYIGDGTEINPIQLNGVSITNAKKTPTPTVVESKLNNTNLWILGAIGLALIITQKS